MKATMRLDKMLANLGFGSRSAIKDSIRRGAVTVNGRTVRDHGAQIDPKRDAVALDGEPVVYRDTVYVLLHKPAGVVSATEDTRDRTVLDLIEADWKALSPFPVGRLDKDTEGLLLLTNDGKLAHELLAPRKHVPKTYRALVAGAVGEEDALRFAAGVELDDGYVTLPAQLRVLAIRPQARERHAEPLSALPQDVSSVSPGAFGGSDDEAVAEGATAEHANNPGGELALAVAAALKAKKDVPGPPLSWIELTVREGKFHQVKRMFEAVGKTVLYLRRVSMGPLALDPALAPGEWRELTEAEVEALRAYRKG